MFVAQVLLLLVSVCTILVQVQASGNPNAHVNQNSPKVSVESSDSYGQQPPVASQVELEQSNNPNNWQVALIEPEEGVLVKHTEKPPPNPDVDLGFIMQKQKLTFMKLDVILGNYNFRWVTTYLKKFEEVVGKVFKKNPTERERLLKHPNVEKIRVALKMVEDMGGEELLNTIESQFERVMNDTYDYAQEKPVDPFELLSRMNSLEIYCLKVAKVVKPLDHFQKIMMEASHLLSPYYSKTLLATVGLIDVISYSQMYKMDRTMEKLYEELHVRFFEKALDLSAGKDYDGAIQDTVQRFESTLKQFQEYIDKKIDKKDKKTSCCSWKKVGFWTVLGALGLYLVKPEWFNWGTGSSSSPPQVTDVTQADLNSTSCTTIESTQLPSSLNSVYIAILVVLAMVAIVAGLVYYFAVYRKNRKSGTKGKDIEACKVSTESSLSLGHKSSKTKRSSKQSPSGFSPSGFNDSTGACTTANSSEKNRSKSSSVPSSAVSQ